MIINDLFTNKKLSMAEDANMNYIWIQGDFDGDTASIGPTQGSWRDQQSTPVKLTRGRMSNVRPLSGPPPEGGKTIKQAQIPLTLDAGDQKFSTTGVDLQLTMAPNGYVTNGEFGRVVGTAVVKIMRPGGVAEDLTRRGFLRGLGAAALAGAGGSALAGTAKPGNLQDLHYAMMEKNPRYAKEHEALGIYVARGMHGASAENNKRWYEKTAQLLQKYGVKVNEGVAENAGQPLSIQQLATISDEALDNAYGYGRSTPGNTFGWQANMKSAAYAKQIIDQGVTDIEAISDAIHKGWNTTAQAFVQNPDQFDDTTKLAAAGKLEAKLQQRAQLMKQNYAQLPEEEKEKDRVVARALVKAIKGDQSLSEGMAGKVVFSGTGADGGKYEIIQSSPNDYMIHANGRHIDTYGSLQRAMSVLKNEVPGLQQGMAEAQTDYQKRRQRERDVDAGKPVKPEPKNPQNDYFARRKKDKDLAEVSLGDYRKKAAVSQAGAKIDRFFDRDDAAKVGAADQTIAKREKGLARADARIKPYTPPKFDAEKYQRDLTAKYPNIDQLVADAERNRDPYYDRAEGEAYYRGREAEQLYQRLKQIQRVIQGLNESQIKENKIKLKEAILIEDPIYRTWKTLGQTLVERRMSEKEILQVFADAEAGMTDRATGANRTMLGRGKDVTVDFAKDLSGAVTGILDSLQNDTPISAVDVAYDRATDAVAKMAGGQKGKVMQAIKGYRNLVKQYPNTAGFAKAALVAITGLATGGAGLPAVAGLTYALDSAIRGDKLSSVIGKGAGAAFLAWLASSIGSGASQTGTADTSAFTGPTSVPPVADLPTYTVQSGDNLSTLADRFGTSVRELRGLNPQLAVDQNALGGQMANPDFIKPGQQLVLPPATGDSVYAGGVGTSANTMSQIGRGNIPDSAISQRMAMRESIQFVTPPLNKIIDRDRTAESWVINESQYQGRQRSVVLTAMGAYAVFENVDRYRQFVLEKAGEPGSTRPKYYRPDMPDGPGKASKPGIIGRGLNWLDKKAKAAGGAISNFGHQFTTDVTKEKLKMNWHQKGKPSDSDELAAWLVTQGVPQQVVTDIYAKMKIPYTPPQAAVAQPGTTEPTAAAEPVAAAEPKKYKQVPSSSGIINPATGRGYTPDELAAEYPDFDFDREEKQAERKRLKDLAKQERLKDKIKASLDDPRDTASDLAKSFVNKGGLGADFKPPSPRPTVTPAPTPVTVKGQPPGFTASNLAQQPGMAQYVQQKPTAPKTAPNFAQGPAGYKTTTTPVALSNRTPTVPASTPVTKKEPIFINGTKVLPSDPLYDKIIKNAPTTSESLTWSPNFNPGRSLYRKMKQES